MYVERTLEPCVLSGCETLMPWRCVQSFATFVKPLAVYDILPRLSSTYSRIHQQVRQTHHNKLVLQTRQWMENATN